MDVTSKSVKIRSATRRRRLRVGDPDFVPPDGGWGWLVVFACGFSNVTRPPPLEPFTNSSFAAEHVPDVPAVRLGLPREVQIPCSYRFQSSTNTRQFEMATTIKVPPDGGYGWVIVFANALSNLIIIPLMQSFGLIFKDTFSAMGLSATQGSLIINLNAAFGMIMGLLNGSLLKIFGYRKVAMAASALVTVGIVLTSFATTFTHFLIAYGLITSFGMGMNMSAFSLAVNTYFRKNKGKAVGYAMTITGLGPILMPQLINGLSRIHTVQGVTLILGGISAHTFVAACLLQPIHWHMKTEILPDENKTVEDKLDDNSSSESLDQIENGPIYGLDEALTGSVISLNTISRKTSVVSHMWGSIDKTHDAVYNPEMSAPIKKKPYWKRWFHRIVRLFDLDLLKDPIYVNIMMGLSLAIFAEINFSLLTAFILAEFGLDTNQIATFMSLLGIADIVFRFLAPHIAKVLKLEARPMYVVTLFLLMLSRFSLLISNNFVVLLVISLGLGVAKGLRTVFMSLVIPVYVPIEKLASASGLQMMVNGFCILVGGPLIGVIRDVTGSYNMCIVVLNMVTFSTITIWSMEYLILRCRKDKPVVELIEQTNTLLNKS